MSGTEEINLEGSARTLEKIERDTLLITLGGALLALLVTRSWANTLGLLLGGITMLANFHFLWKLLRKALEGNTGNRLLLVVKGVFPFLLFLGAVAFILLVLKLPVIPFFLGTLSLLAGIVLRSLVFRS